ncbi:hypothetical protein B0H10DRAFT_1766889, partial [Mycena sp. CBHHK59/15]
IRLPNGHIIRSVWKESKLTTVRIARNIKVRDQSNDDWNILYGEVQLFFKAGIKDEEPTLVLISVYSPPDTSLLERS